MSINVTVTGNPVKIKRGTMVTANPEYARNEFEKRRLMRLQQVRQQSKDIAESVRKKVRNEKKKHLSDIEKESEDKLLEQKNRKLLELQNQYCECLKDIGVGHTQAALEETHEGIIQAFKEALANKCKEHGQAAIQKEQAEKSEENAKKIIPVQRKKLVRDVEGTRAALVSKLKNQQQKKERSQKVNVPVEIEYNSDVNLVDISSCSISSCFEDVSESSETPVQNMDTLPEQPKSKDAREEQQDVFNGREPHTVVGVRDDPNREHLPLNLTEEVPSALTNTNNPTYDTRLSDIINKRISVSSAVNKSETAKSTQLFDANMYGVDEHIESQVKQDTGKGLTNTRTSVSKEKSCCVNCTCMGSNPNLLNLQDKVQIPSKPTVILKSSSESKNNISDPHMVQYYDHSNRYSGKCNHDGVCAHKIPESSIQVCPNILNEKEYFERMYQRDRDAEIRGRKALEKQRLDRDYKELMKQLPVLQKIERIASIDTNKDKYHLSEDRLMERDKRKQNQMENAYQKLLSNTTGLVTLPKKDHNAEKEPFKVINLQDKEIGAKFGTWETRSRELNEENNILKRNTTENNDINEEKLKKMLEKLKKNRELLIKDLYSTSSVNEKRDSLGSDPRCSKHNKCDCDCLYTANRKKKGKKNILPEKVSSSTNSNSTQSPIKRGKHSKHVLVLQNTSTQTTPRLSEEIKSSNRSKGEIKQRPKSLKRAKLKSTRKICGKETSEDKLQKVSTSTSENSDMLSVDNKVNIKTYNDENTQKEKEIIEKKSQSTSPILTQKFETRATSPISEDISKIKPLLRVGSSPERKICEKRSREVQQKELCEILIKIMEDDTPEIFITSPKKIKAATVKPNVTNVEKPHIERNKVKPKTNARKVNIDETSHKATSWREELSRNNESNGTNTTSYLSLPNHLRVNSTETSTIQNTTDESIQNGFLKSLSKKLQQGNISDDARNLIKDFDPRLLVYIKKLLKMSRASVEELNVSSVSDVSTPSSSLIDVNKNKPLNKLLNIMKILNLTGSDLQHLLNLSEDSMSKNSQHYTASSSSSESSTVILTCDPIQKKEMEFETEDRLPTPVINFTESAQLRLQRIIDLSMEIDSVRSEKQRLLSPGLDTKTTEYLNSELKSVDWNKKQAELNEKLLHIRKEYFLDDIKTEVAETDKSFVVPDDIDRDIVERYLKLLDVNVIEMEPIKEVNISENKTEATTEFVPLLLDVQKLPKLAVHFNNNENNQSTNNQCEKRKKPPTARGLSVARKYNGEIVDIPHELSTIMEVDSRLSLTTKHSKSPDFVAKANSLNYPAVVEPPTSKLTPEQKPKSLSFQSKNVKKNESNSQKTSDDSMPDIVAELIKDDIDNKSSQKPLHSENTSNSSTKSSGSENLDAILQRMGMSWALTTLKKTRASMTQDSSSSSHESNIKSRQSGIRFCETEVSDNSNTSEVTLRDFLGQKVFTSSSSAKSDSHSSPLTREFENISAIQGSLASSETKRQRTSTPIHTTKSTSKSENNSSIGKSDSSAKEPSTFHAMNINNTSSSISR